MPDLIKLYIRSAAWGFVISAVFVGLLMWFNVMNLWTLVAGSSSGIIALVLLWVAHGIVFGAVQFAWAIMDMADDDDDEPRGGTPIGPELRPIPVPAQRKGRGGIGNRPGQRSQGTRR